jgi:hypothetical protein
VAVVGMNARALWDRLIPAAMVGTARHPLNLSAFDASLLDTVQALKTATAHPAQVLLRSAALLASCEAAGYQPSVLDPSCASALPDAAPNDAIAVAPEAAAHALDWVLRDAPVRLAGELLRYVQQHGMRLPARLLPAALELGRQCAQLRCDLLPVLGERGNWLARVQPQWTCVLSSSVQTPAELRWSEGRLQQRVSALREWRAENPSRARERLLAVFSELPAKERAELLAALAMGLSMADCGLLELCCHDRSLEVRQVARRLLLQLPESGWVQRAIQRVAAMLGWVAGSTRKPRTIEAPLLAGSDWEIDGIELQRPKGESLGERAWLLYQLVRQVPLNWWVQTLGLSPPLLLKWAAGSDWAAALQRAWHDVLLVAPEANFAEAFLLDWPNAVVKDPRAVLALLSPQRHEAWLIRQLQAGGKLDLVEFVEQWLGVCAFATQMNAVLAELLLPVLLQALRRGALRENYALRNLLPELCCVLPMAQLAPLSVWCESDVGSPALQDLSRLLALLIAIRQGFVQMLQPATTPENVA